MKRILIVIGCLVLMAGLAMAGGACRDGDTEELKDGLEWWDDMYGDRDHNDYIYIDDDQDEPEEDDSDDTTLYTMLKRIPADIEMFMFLDVEGIQADDDWLDMLEDSWDMSEAGIDVDTEDIEAFAMAMTEDFGTITLIEGSFDSDELADALEDAGCDDDTYKGVAIWEMESYYDAMWVALWDGLLITGSDDDVKDCIDVIEEGEDSLYDNDDFKAAADRLGDGLVMMMGQGGDFAEYEDAEVLGVSYDKKDSDTARVKAVVVFEDEEAAADAIDDIEDDLDDEDWENIDIEQSGRIVEVSGEVDIADMTF